MEQKVLLPDPGIPECFATWLWRPRLIAQPDALAELLFIILSLPISSVVFFTNSNFLIAIVIIKSMFATTIFLVSIKKI